MDIIIYNNMVMIIDILKLISIFVLGFFLPGYLVARMLHSRMIHVTSILGSILILFQTIFYLQIADIPLRYDTLICTLLGITIALSALFHFRKKANLIKPIDDPISKPSPFFIIFSIAILLLITYRLTMAPLTGPDIIFRWEHLPKLMLTHQNFDFYPPFTGEDYTKYFFTDSFPPMVQFTYFSLYSAISTHSKEVANLLTILQFVLIIFSAYYIIKKETDSTHSDTFLILFLFSNFSFFKILSYGQENGWLSISLLLTWFFLYKNEDKTSNFILAAIITSVGTLSREYGGFIFCCGILLCFVYKVKMKHLLVYAAIVSALIAPWFIRTWVITGNPVYSLNLLGFYVNPGHKEVLNQLNLISGLTINTKVRITKTIILLIQFAFIPIVFGFWYLIKNRKVGLLILILFNTIIWIMSIRFTASIEGSLKVLLPSLIILCIDAAIFLSKNYKKAQLSISLVAGFILCLGLCVNIFIYQKGTTIKGIFIALFLIIITLEVIFFLRQRENISQITISVMFAVSVTWVILNISIYPTSISYINSIGDMIIHVTRRHNVPILEDAFWTNFRHKVKGRFRVIGENPYIHSITYGTNVELIPLWSPEIAFLMNEKHDAEEFYQRLRELNIHGFLYYPNVYTGKWYEQTPFYKACMFGDRKLIKHPNLSAGDGEWQLYLVPPARKINDTKK
ncbi:MAG: hypothetical protein HRT89_22835 [Lentisphaeria bacterium]|nr:hypothetical protein [Lentisphaeria bacterium]NQZ70897.1 hypothetical protein [Lentisphaeria bacterium]